MKYVVAVSGGVDSVVLLDMLVRSGRGDLVVAHFDHGIRPDSAADARFVAGLAEKYGLPFETERAELGPSASEETARIHRYAFLRAMARRHEGRIVTAHHQDDVIETIVINLRRGTGWRGLAVLNDPTIARPLLGAKKSQLYDYAVKRGLEWVEDETNSSDVYMRNRIRRQLGGFDEQSRSALLELHTKQRELVGKIDSETEKLSTPSRHFFTMVDEAVAMELLRAQLASAGLSLTRPRRFRLLHAIKTARAGDTFQAGSGVSVSFTSAKFIVKHPL